MPRLTKKMIDARVQRAITGFQIPIMSIPRLYARLEHAIRSDMTDDYLREIVAKDFGAHNA